MNKLLGLLTIILLLGCTSSVKNDSNTSSQPSETQPECDKSVSFGGVNLCLPSIDGMTECYSLPIVKALADRTEYEKNSVLAYYLNNEVYKQVDRLNDITFDDYFKIYIVNGLKDTKVVQSDLDRMADMMEDNFIKKNWSDIKQKSEAAFGFLSIGKPVFMESYSPHKNVRTQVMLIKYQMENYEKVVLSIINFIMLKQRLICMAYYRDYENPESVIDFKSKNDYIVLSIMEENGGI